MTYHSMMFTPLGKIGALEDDLKKTKNIYSSAYTKLILRVKKLKSRVKIRKVRRQARVILSDDEDLEDNSSKQGRKLSDVGDGSEKGSDEVSTAGAKQEKRSRQDKVKSIMIESEPKKELEQERLSYAKAIRLEEQMNEEQRAQIARDEEIARQWDEEERQRAMIKAQDRDNDGEDAEMKSSKDFRHHTKRRDVEELYRLVKERYSASRPEGFDLMLWGDLHTLFEPDEDDEI
ncbi:hypothetical protein Tco_0144736 [Tanacetum coccineum]